MRSLPISTAALLPRISATSTTCFTILNRKCSTIQGSLNGKILMGRAHFFPGLNLILKYVRQNASLFKALLSDNCEPDIQREIMKLPDIISVRFTKALTSAPGLPFRFRHHRLRKHPAKMAAGRHAGVYQADIRTYFTGLIPRHRRFFMDGPAVNGSLPGGNPRNIYTSQ